MRFSFFRRNHDPKLDTPANVDALAAERNELREAWIDACRSVSKVEAQRDHVIRQNLLTRHRIDQVEARCRDMGREVIRLRRNRMKAAGQLRTLRELHRELEEYINEPEQSWDAKEED